MSKNTGAVFIGLIQRLLKSIADFLKKNVSQY